MSERFPKFIKSKQRKRKQLKFVEMQGVGLYFQMRPKT